MHAFPLVPVRLTGYDDYMWTVVSNLLRRRKARKRATAALVVAMTALRIQEGFCSELKALRAPIADVDLMGRRALGYIQSFVIEMLQRGGVAPDEMLPYIRQAFETVFDTRAAGLMQEAGRRFQMNDQELFYGANEALADIRRWREDSPPMGLLAIYADDQPTPTERIVLRPSDE